jgi:hypothetical protein
MLGIGLFSIIGVLILGYGLQRAFKSRQAADWPVSPGTMTLLELEEDSDPDGTTWRVKTEYTYEVDGQVHSGKRLAFGYAGSSEKIAHEQIYERLKQSSGFDVRYSPQDSAVSTLSFGVHKSIMLFIGFGLFWLTFCGGMALMVWVMSGSDHVLLENLSTR